LASGKVIGMEALVRWQHPEFGVLPPARFIHLAEDTGLILKVADLVMSNACAQARSWQENGCGNLRMAVNISARQFQDQNFQEKIVRILGETSLDPRSLELEITETSIMENADSAVKALSAIRELGVRIAIDDFGTGYSSLSYLKRLPIDTVKLDQSFVKGATSDPSDAALVMAIITLAHNLRLRVIAEGVETEEQREFLWLLRCDEVQGYLFGKPASPDAFESMLHSGAQRKQDRVLAAPRSELRIARTTVNK
jgi:EAL domain-containing protein (putative c-di-GMP-specific phosphodiesterase class I)